MSDAVKELEKLPVNSMVKMDGKEYGIAASVTFHELYQTGGSSAWVRRGKQSRGLVLSNKQLLLRVPAEEGGRYVWLRLKPTTEASNLRGFYKGGDSPGEWGPARRFAKQEQSGEVLYDLLGTKWQVRDIGTLEVEVDGESAWLHSGDRLYFVTSQAVAQNEWLVYLDARPGEAQGTGGLFRGVAFQPNELIEEVL